MEATSLRLNSDLVPWIPERQSKHGENENEKKKPLKRRDLNVQECVCVCMYVYVVYVLAIYWLCWLYCSNVNNKSF